MYKILLLIPFLFLVSCTGKPDGVAPVHGFDAERYLGTWYEIARLDHSFERGLNNVTAEYSLKDNGDIRVINKGYSKEDQEWEIAEGTAKFVENENLGHLKVSFFGPFYGSYIVFKLDQENYDYAFVSGPDTSYLWLLARTPDLAPSIIEDFVQTSKNLGFNTDNLIFVEHD